MSEFENALPLGGPAKLTQKRSLPQEKLARYRLYLLLTFGWCLLAVDAAFWRPAAGLTLCVFAWYALLLGWKGPAVFQNNRVLMLSNLFLALTFVLGSNWYFRYWNLLALLVLVPVHMFASTGLLPWWNPTMFLERIWLFLRGLFGNLWVCFAAAFPSGKKKMDSKHTVAIVAGSAGALVLVAFLLPVLASADALFAAATADFRMFIQRHFTASLGEFFWALVLTPLAFSLLYSLSCPVETKEKKTALPVLDGLAFVFVLTALVVLYLLFLLVQSAGLFGGPEYLAARNIHYAQWARSGFFQMVGVTCVNLTVLLAALTLSNRTEKAIWNLIHILAAILTVESLVLLASAAWRMTLYVKAYGLSFLRFMTYWGMVMMALFLLAAAVKIRKPDFNYCRCVFPLALAGWLIVNCVPVDYLVSRNQVERYLNHESITINIHYLVYNLSYDALKPLEQLDGAENLNQYEASWWGTNETLQGLLEQRKVTARKQCSDWRTWSLSAYLASR